MARAARPSREIEDEAGRDKQGVLDRAINEILKQYGDGAVMRLGEATHLAVETIPTGSLALDLALGVGGVPRGRVTEIFGPESSGKTSLGQHRAGPAGAGPGAGGGGRAARAGDGDLRAGVVGQDDAVPAHRGGSAEAGRDVRLYRHGTCAGPGVCGQVRGGRGQPVHLAAGHGGTGAGDRRDASAERGGGRGGGGQRGGAGAAGGDRGG